MKAKSGTVFLGIDRVSDTGCSQLQSEYENLKDDCRVLQEKYDNREIEIQKIYVLKDVCGGGGKC